MKTTTTQTIIKHFRIKCQHILKNQGTILDKEECEEGYHFGFRSQE